MPTPFDGLETFIDDEQNDDPADCTKPYQAEQTVDFDGIMQAYETDDGYKLQVFHHKTGQNKYSIKLRRVRGTFDDPVIATGAADTNQSLFEQVELLLKTRHIHAETALASETDKEIA